MKELLIEEKAKTLDGNYNAYTELINRLENVKDAIKKQNYGIAMDILYKPCPEYQIITSTEPKGEDYGIDGLYAAIDILQKTLGKVDGYQTDDGILSHKCAISAVNELSKQKPAWTEEDEYYRNIILYILNNEIVGKADKENTISWFQSLKDRVHPKQELTEEDLTKLKSAITLLEHPAVISDNTGIQEKTIDFLKSLKDKVQPQSHWKPSEGQMKALGNCVCKTWFDKDMLKTLYNDLQNL